MNHPGSKSRNLLNNGDNLSLRDVRRDQSALYNRVINSVIGERALEEDSPLSSSNDENKILEDEANLFDKQKAIQEAKKERERLMKEKIASWTPEEKEIDLGQYFAGMKEISNFDADYQIAIREGLKSRLYRGYSKHEGKLVQFTVRSIFDTESFQSNQREIGIMFDDPEIFGLSLHGFIKTICSPHGGLSDQAKWYYETILSYYPEKFLHCLNEFFKSDGCLNYQREQINAFLQQNEEIQEYLRRRREKNDRN